MIVFGLAFVCVGISFFARKRLLRYLRFLQQDNYYSIRFIKWVWESRSFDRRGSLIAGCSSALAYFLPMASCYLGGLALLLLAWLEEDPQHSGKLPLKMTERAKRIYHTACAIFALFFLASIWISVAWMWAIQIVLFQMIPLCLTLACGMLSWGENKRQADYAAEARKLISESGLFVIGITGSYGKTSTKEALAQILQMALGPTFWPPKGINTAMGITKEIRSKLRKGYRYAVIEMAAYKRGSIKDLCRLTPPQAAIITGIGTAHLERFGSTEEIFRAKSELAQALPEDGILICNGDNPGSRRIAHEWRKKTTLLYGLDKAKGPLDCWIASKEVTLKGTYFDLEFFGKKYQGFTPLLGNPALSNIAGSFAMACILGGQPEYILAVIANLQPVENRLQVQKEGGATFLRDAYNSNPIGFAAALEVLAAIPGKKRIMMTPGIIELGQRQHAENKKVGRLAAAACDFAVIVNEENKNALREGLLDGGMPLEHIFCCPTRKEGYQQLNRLIGADAIVLIENDLPDLYEVHERF